jgi:RNA polymerase sigma factor (sigma-70 family)
MSGSGPNTRHRQPKLLAVPAGTASARAATDSASDRSGWVAALFTAHNRALLRFLTCRLKSAQEAKEVAQEAYVRMLRLDSPDGVGYLRAFLFKTAANLATDRLKSAARRERIDQLEFFDDAQLEPSPEEGLSAEQELQAIARILDELPARCRYAFVMHRFHGNSIAEVASSMNLSVRTIQLYVERALVFCRDRLRQSSGGRDE